MKLLLIQPPNTNEVMADLYPSNYKEARSVLPPLGLLSLASYLKSRHDVTVIDMILENKTVDDVPGILDEIKPDIVGVTSIIGLWPSVLKIFHKIKLHDSTIRTVVGGPNATYYPAETFAHKDIDYVIVGNGQKPLMELCDRLDKRVSCVGIENCYVRGIQYNQFKCVYSDDHYIERYPFPDRRFTPHEQYSVPFCPENPTTTMITSMGCPFKCEFCTRTRPPVQFISLKNIIEELIDIQKLGIKSIMFQDELFTLHKERIMDFCRIIIKYGIRLNWMIKSRIDMIETDMLEPMINAGCFSIHFGIESGNDSTLKKMKKGYTSQKVRDVVAMVKASGIKCTGNFMLAYPGESVDDILKSIDFAKELNLDLAQFSLTIDSPGSRLFDEAVTLGRRNKDYLSEYTAHPDPNNSGIPTTLFSASDKFTDNELHNFLNIAYSNTRTLFNI